MIPKRRLVDDGEAPVGLAKASRAELFDDGLDSVDDDVVPEDDDDIDNDLNRQINKIELNDQPVSSNNQGASAA